jgi:L-alanine-DL-glutamate epimerase-like enolase superfamily enzyme
MGYLIYADESISTEKDVPKLFPFVHGVNIKMEKASGIRGCLKVIDAAKACGLKVS